MKRYLTLLGQAAIVFALTYVMPAIVATAITFNIHVYMEWVTSTNYACVMGFCASIAALVFMAVQVEKYD